MYLPAPRNLRRERIVIWGIILSSLAIGIAGFGIFKTYLDSLPRWELTARNSKAGLVIEAFEERAAKPTFVVVLEGKSIDRELERIQRLEFESIGGVTTHSDETFKPGDWIFIVADTKITMNPARLIVNDKRIFPEESVTIELR